MSSRFESFQKLLHDKCFNYYLGLTEEETDKEISNSRILTLGWVTSHFDRLRAFHNIFYPMLNDVCHKKLVSGGTRVKLLSEYCDFNLLVRECVKVIMEGISYAQRWASLAESVVSAFQPNSEEFVAVGDPGPKFTFSNFRDGTLFLSLLKEELFQEEGTYEHALIRFVGTIGMNQYKSPVDTDISCYFRWCDVSSEFLSQKLRLMANQLRHGPLTGNVNLLVYSMNFVMFWCTMVISLAFVPRANGRFFGKDFSIGRVYSVGPKVPWKNAYDSLLEKMWKVLHMDSCDKLSIFDVLPKDLSYGSLKQSRSIACSTKFLCDLLEGVEYLLITADHIAEINHHVDEFGRATSFFCGNLKGFEMKLEDIIGELEDSWAKAIDLLEKV